MVALHVVAWTRDWMRQCVAAAFVTCVLALAAHPVQAQQIERIAAVVNDKIISLRDLEDRTKLVIASSRLPDNAQTKRRLLPQVLRTLIDEELQVQEAERLSIEVTDQDIDRAKRLTEQRSNIPEGGLDDYLKRNGLSVDTAVAQLKSSIAWTKLIRRRFAVDAEVTEEEVQETLDQIKDSFGKPQSRVLEILLTVEDSRQENEIRASAQRLSEQIRDGSSFTALAREFSQGANAATGGEIGWVAPGQLSDEIDQAVQKLAVGQVSDPIRTVFGYHVLKVEDRRVQSEVDPLEAEVTLKQVFMPLAAEAGQSEVASQFSIAQAITQSARDCTDMEGLAKEVRSPAGADLGKFKIKDLAPALRDPVAALQVGKPSDPVRLPTGFTVLMVCERTDPESNLPSRDEIRNRLRSRKLETFSRRYMRDVRRAAFVEPRV